MDNGRRRIELMHSLLFTLPGTPVLYYGDEIGMGDNIYLGDRNGVRTPMQWTRDRNAGFSRADAARLYAPVIADPVYGYQASTWRRRSASASSLLNWMKRLIRVRQRYPAFAHGQAALLEPGRTARCSPSCASDEGQTPARGLQPLALRAAGRAGAARVRGPGARWS